MCSVHCARHGREKKIVWTYQDIDLSLYCTLDTNMEGRRGELRAQTSARNRAGPGGNASVDL